MTSKLPRMPNNDTELDSLTSQAFFPHQDLRIPKVAMHAYKPSQCCLRTKSFVKKGNIMMSGLLLPVLTVKLTHLYLSRQIPHS